MTISQDSQSLALGLILIVAPQLCWRFTSKAVVAMVAGRPPFRGETKSHMVVSILEAEPPPLSYLRRRLLQSSSASCARR